MSVETVFAKLEKVAVAGIVELLEKSGIRCTYHSNEGYPDTWFLRFSFRACMHAMEHLNVAKTVCDCAELLTVATRNSWIFSPQLMTEIGTDGRAFCFYVVPVAREHQRVLNGFASYCLPLPKEKHAPNPRRKSQRAEAAGGTSRR